MRQWCSGQCFDWYLFLKYYWVWSPRKATLPLHLYMHKYLRMRTYKLKYQGDLNSSPRMDVGDFWNRKIRSMVSVRVYVSSGNTWQRSWRKVVWSSQSLIPAFFGVRKSHVFYTFMILYFGVGTKMTSITWQCICNIRVIICNNRMTLQASWGWLWIAWDEKTWLIQRIIEAVGLDDGMLKVKFKPSDQRPLVRNSDDKPPSGIFIYSSIFGIFLYLSGHTSTDIASTINFCGRYIFRPKRSHEDILKRLEQFLKHT